MALWLIRGGSEGEHEEKFLSESRVYVTWEGLNVDLKKLDWDGLLKKLQEIYDDAGKGRITNWASQLYPFAHEMKKGDWVVMPRKGKSVIAIAEIEGEYQHNPKGEDPYFHYRPVKWIKTDIPKSNFDQDVLYSFGAFMTICRLQRNDAEARVRAMAANGWKATSIGPVVHDKSTATDVSTEQSLDIEQIARDSISKRIIARFKGHAMERLIEAVLNAQGYVTYRSPEGADKGIDILAAQGPLGFGRPRICVQVKSGGIVDHPTFSQLLGTMQSVQAEQGLLVSWDGFKPTVDKEVAKEFFRVRLWSQDTLIEELLAVYDKLDPKIRAELPLKRVWTLVPDTESEPA